MAQERGSGRTGGRRRNLLTLAALGLLLAGMTGLVSVSVPLYRLFCQVTGFGGTTQVATQAPEKTTERTFTVRFDGTVNPSLGWAFRPVQRTLKLKAGENKLAFYEAENQGDETVVGTATFNVTPDKAGIYFNKIDCFCFTEQVLKPGQRVDMPVNFFIDPEIADDPNLEEVTTITLSYTFFRSEDQTAARRQDQAAVQGTKDSSRALDRALN